MFSGGDFFYYKYEAKRTKDCSGAAGGHRKRVNKVDMHPKKVTVKKVTGVELVTLYILN